MDHADASPGSRSALAAVLGVIGVVVLTYLPSALRADFVYDDYRFIVDNPHVVEPGGWQGWLDLLLDPRTTDPNSPGGIVRPLRNLEFALDHALFGLSPLAFRVHSLVWHALASVLVLRLLQRLTGALVPAVAGALFFAVHPMHVEAVAFISSRADVAMGACVLGALLLELRDTRSARIAALVLVAVAALYKETAVVAPLLVFGLRLAAPREGPGGRVVAAAREALPYAGVVVAYIVFRSMVQVGSTAHVQTFVLGGSTAGTFATMFRGFGVYVVSVLLPVGPAVDWYLAPATSLVQPSVLAWLVVHATVIGIAVLRRGRWPLVSAAICCVYFPLIPVANWPFPIGIPTADRFLYLSVLGGALVVAVGVLRAGRTALPAATVAVLSMAAISGVDAGKWQDDDALMRSALGHGTSARAHAHFGAVGRETGLELWRRAARTEDADERARLHDESRAEFERALAHLHSSLDLWHRFETVSHSTSFVVVQPHVNAASVCLYLGRPREALWHADRSIAADDRTYYQGFYNRALALLALERPVPAVLALQQTRALGMPADDRAFVRNCLRAGDACLELGAREHASMAFRLIEAAAPEVAHERLRAVEARRLTDEERSRAVPGAEGIETECPAWRDHGLD